MRGLRLARRANHELQKRTEDAASCLEAVGAVDWAYVEVVKDDEEEKEEKKGRVDGLR